jgi:hypothetical protein
MSGYKVEYMKPSEINSETLRIWLCVYAPHYEYSDLHQEFADKLGLSRQDAKSLAHSVAHTVGLACKNLVGY